MDSDQSQILGTEKIPKLMARLAVPSIIAQLINVLYNLVDRMYIGHIQDVGDVALTGLGVTFPIIMLISAFSAFVGAGGAPLASIAMGQGNKEKAEKILGNGTLMLIVFSAVLTIVFMIFKVPLLYLFGASENTIGYADQYITIYLIGTLFVQLSLGLNMFISSQGQAKVAMISVLVGAVTNIILDPILIFGFNMGVSGAAIATILSQAISAAWVIRFLISDKSVIRIKKKYMKPDRKIIMDTAALGVSPFIMQATESAIMIVLNRGLQIYGGDLYVGSMTILQSVMQLLVVPIQGLTQGVQPIISYNYGAAKFERVKKTVKTLLFAACTASTIGCLVCIFFPMIFAGIFTSKPELISLVGQVLPIYISGMWIFGVQMSCQTAFVGMGQAKISLFLALLRKVILLIPMAIILPRYFGVMGIYYSEPIADTISASTAGLIFLFNYKNILSEKALNKLS